MGPFLVLMKVVVSTQCVATDPKNLAKNAMLALVMAAVLHLVVARVRTMSLVLSVQMARLTLVKPALAALMMYLQIQLRVPLATAPPIFVG